MMDDQLVEAIQYVDQFLISYQEDESPDIENPQDILNFIKATLYEARKCLAEFERVKGG